MAMRREVYFEAIESLAATVLGLSKYASVEVSNNAIAVNAEKNLGPASRVSLIASIETYQIISDFLQNGVKAVSEVAIQRFALTIIKTDADNALDFAKSLSANDTRFENAWKDVHIKQMVFFNSQMELLELAIRLAERLIPFQAQVVCAMRSELNLEVDKPLFIKLMQSQATANAAEMRSAIREVKSKIEQKISNK